MIRRSLLASMSRMLSQSDLLNPNSTSALLLAVPSQIQLQRVRPNPFRHLRKRNRLIHILHRTRKRSRVCPRSMIMVHVLSRTLWPSQYHRIAELFNEARAGSGPSEHARRSAWVRNGQREYRRERRELLEWRSVLALLTGFSRKRRIYSTTDSW